MRVVYDTNVYLSSLFWSGPPDILLRLAARGYVQLVASDFILEELAKVLRRSFGATDDAIEGIIERFAAMSLRVYPKESLDVVRDKKDSRILECAIEGRCDYLVTGDSDLLVLRQYNGVRIVTPKEFLEILRGT